MSKLTPEVERILADVEGDAYVRLDCNLTEGVLRDEYRAKLQEELHCTHFLQFGMTCSIEIPRKYVDELTSWDVVHKVRRVLKVF